VAVIYSPWQHFTNTDNSWHATGPIVRSNVDEDTISAILRDRLFGYLGPPMIRRDALEAVGGFSSQMTLGEDFALMLRIAMSGYKFHLMESAEPLFFYRQTPGALWRTSSVDVKAVMRLMQAIRAAETYLQDLPIATAIARATDLDIAARYIRRLDVLQFGDSKGFHLVLGWISDLRLRSAPAGSHLALRLVARIAGLSNTLKLRFALRSMLRALRAARHPNTSMGKDTSS
jgi:hypothetical protein